MNCEIEVENQTFSKIEHFLLGVVGENCSKSAPLPVIVEQLRGSFVRCVAATIPHRRPSTSESGQVVVCPQR